MDSIPGAVSDEKPLNNPDGEPRHSSHLVTSFVPVGDLKPLPGDLIEFKRDLYSHWALYVGDGQAMHVRGRGHIFVNGNAIIALDTLEYLAETSTCRINNQEAEAATRGLQALDVKELMEKANNLVGKAVPYRLFDKNCEHYVTEWRYGRPWSKELEIRIKQFTDLAAIARENNLPQFKATLQSFLKHP